MTQPETEPAPDPGQKPRRFAAVARRLGSGSSIFALGLCLGLLLSFSLEQHAATGRVLRGVVLRHAGSDVLLGGLDERELDAVLAPIERDLTGKRLTYTLDGRSFEAAAQELGVTLDRKGFAELALQVGRSGTWPARAWWWLGRLFTTAPLTIEPEIDAARLRATVARWEAEVLEEPPREPGLAYDGELHAIYPEPTHVADTDAVLEALARRIPGEQTTPLEIPVLAKVPAIGRAEVDARLAEARRLLAAPVRLEITGTEHGLELDAALLGPAIRTRAVELPWPALVLELDPTGLAGAFDDLRSEVEQPARSATFAVDGKNQVSVVPSEPGVRIDEGATLREVLEAAKRPDRRGRIVLREEHPELTTEEAEALGVRGLVAHFTTRHPCCQPRVKNIHFAASQADGLLLRPGERFSLNELLGPRTNEAGFLDAPTIVRGKMEASPGGGISQFATTLFNAVLDGGYEIIQRQPHTFYFPRYPEGHEATVSFPEPDLIFRNDTRSGLLIKTQYTSTYIRVLLYGDNEGRRVERKVSERFDVVEPPTEYEPNESLEPDETKRKTRGQPGWSVLVTRLLHYPDGRSVDQTRRVVYRPRPEVLEVHPCNIPKGEEGYTGEKCPEPELLEEPDSEVAEQGTEDSAETTEGGTTTGPTGSEVAISPPTPTRERDD